MKSGNGKRATRRFFRKSAPCLAQALVGTYIVRVYRGKELVGKIVEVEAYLPHNDPVAHGFRGKKSRNASLYKDAGHSYVHTMRHHTLCDIVGEKQGIPGSVLIRAVEPLEGISLMERARNNKTRLLLTSGPARFCRAFHITRTLDGVDLTDPLSPFFILLPAKKDPDLIISVSARIGISKGKEKLLRFFISGNPFVSR